MRAVAFLALSVLVATAASAQSLADVARQESDRRQAVPAPGKSYSNKDLKPTRVASVDGAAPSAAPGTPAAAADTTQPAPDASDAAKDGADAADVSDKTSEVKDEKYWSKRMAALREQLERDQTFLQALQSRIDSLTTDFVNRDDPAQRGQIAADRQKTLAELERLRKAIEADKKAIPDLEDEARRGGVPAGWLR